MPEDYELGVLLDLVEHYEDKHYPIEPPDPVVAIEFEMDPAGADPSGPGSLHWQPGQGGGGALPPGGHHHAHGQGPPCTSTWA